MPRNNAKSKRAKRQAQAAASATTEESEATEAVESDSTLHCSTSHRKVTTSRADPVSLKIDVNSLRMSDVQLLHGPHWLNEALMNFYFAYLAEMKYKGNKDFLFITPEMGQCMLYMDEQELQALLVTQHDARRKPFIFIALGDSKSNELGGAYWSLLVVSRPDKCFFHFDSYGGNHTSTSIELMNNVKDVLDMRQARFRPMRCLQQSNGYDCGIHVICMADQIADYVNRYESVDGLPPLQLDVVKAKRSDLLKLIHSLGGRT
ncbi:sentrin-specific protease 8-like [Scaptodrosophila lebanonensis]|uniref:Sentrin-specific protease 8-like n=1 Tax=Drosophila lebanonensis TaxID=7225 RepID=A0A6J2TVV3_DROLE|nr:sentrin-specific protease 8-like [Scaptodrosophila lebanonensis]XP_030379680.1 sentrin-specific protease 8-like [Scaptodrosophila lebanonensis]